MNSSGGWMTPSITKEEQLHESVKELSTSRNQDRSLSAELMGLASLFLQLNSDF